MWKWEQRKMERLCYDFVAKNSELSGTLPDALRGAFEALVAEGGMPKFRCGRDGTWSLNYTPSPNETEAPKHESPAVYAVRRSQSNRGARIPYRRDTAARGHWCAV